MCPSEKSTPIILGGCVRTLANRLREVILFMPQHWGYHTCSNRSSPRHTRTEHEHVQESPAQGHDNG